MPTNDERRKIAARLEMYGNLDMEGCSPWRLLMEAVYGDEKQHDSNETFFVLSDLIEPEPERTCLVLYVKHGPIFDVLRFSCCGYEWAENRTDEGATEPDPNFCPNCGARVVE